LRIGDVVDSSVPVVGNTPGEIVALHCGSDTSKPFPINFVKTVRLQDECGHNSCARGCLHNSGYFAEEYIIFGSERRRLFLCVNGELQPRAVDGDLFGISKDSEQVKIRPGLEVPGGRSVGEPWIGRTCGLCWVAGREGLSCDKGRQ